MTRRVLLHSGGAGAEPVPFSVEREFLAATPHLLFVPFALADHAGYTTMLGERLARAGLTLEQMPADRASARAALHHAEALLVGGGNTFRLLKTLYDLDLLDPIRDAVAAGLPYVGASAGSNVACPTIRTTNDMPICSPPRMEALGLVPFQINAHYQDPDPTSTHQGETREQRLREYHEMNSLPVLGLREVSRVERRDNAYVLHGPSDSRLFLKGEPARDLAPGSDLSPLLQTQGGRS